MTDSGIDKLGGPAAWKGTDLLATRDWIRPLGGMATEELDAALRAANDRGQDWQALTADDFPLPTLGRAMAGVAEELENGRGVVKLTGVPVDRYGERDLRALFFGLCSHIGIPVPQNGGRGMMRDIRDSDGARVDSADGLRWHNDRTDVVALLCVRKAESGGVSRIVSAVAIHDEMQKRRPDLLALLYQDYYRSTVGDEVGAEKPFYPLPIFALCDGHFTCNFSKTYIEQAQRIPEVPRLTEAQRAAVEMVIELAEELCFEMPLEPGDLQLLNNHVIYHGRTPFSDDAAAGRDRLLYRIWLSMPNSRPLPESHRVLWGRVEAGALRGGATASQL
ncbi:MAG: TauD/TfdA family dioxygenase [Gammaproteobacteria bacterium]